MTTKRKPGPPKGTPAIGHRPRTPPATTEQRVFWARWQLFPASPRPSIRQLAAVVAQGRDTVARKLLAQGAGLSDAQLLAANALLDKHADAFWGTAPLIAQETKRK